MYVVQTFMHSLIAILIIERAIQIWKITNPVSLFRYRLMTLILPIMMFPLYHIVNFNRNSLSFREEEALLNTSRWLIIDIWDMVTVNSLFLIFLGATSLIFFLQEVAPIIKDYLFSRKEDTASLVPVNEDIETMVSRLSNDLRIDKPPVTIVDDETPVVLAAGSKNHTVLLSTGLIKMLNRDQLYSAIAHEFAHIVRRSNATTWAVFMLRMLMFFNPIALIVFRRIVQDDEHICDDITVSLTKQPFVLASTLKAFYSSSLDANPSFLRRVSSMKEGIENHSHNLLLKERIARLESTDSPTETDFEWGKFLLTAGTIIIINYFVV